MKRSRALRGRNLTRNSRIDGAPKPTCPRAALGGYFASGSASDTGVMPQKSGCEATIRSLPLVDAALIPKC